MVVPEISAVFFYVLDPLLGHNRERCDDCPGIGYTQIYVKSRGLLSSKTVSLVYLTI
jgi:hypothetical protein